MFAYAAIHFGKWWITLFSFIPLLLFSSHTLIVDADLDAAKEGGENDS
jgi:predicted secreted protein